MQTHIYGLFDAGGHIRYVGKTVHSVEARLARHIWTARRGTRTHNACWIRSMLEVGKRPTIQIIETRDGDGSFEERWWIAQFRRVGIDLTNTTDGGEGASGLSHSAETRQKTSAALQGHGCSTETRQKMSAARKGRVISAETRQKRIGRVASAETRQKMSASRMGLVASTETRQKISAATTGRVFSAETRQKLSAASTAWYAARRSQTEMVPAQSC